MSKQENPISDVITKEMTRVLFEETGPDSMTFTGESLFRFAQHFTELGRRIERTALGSQVKYLQEKLEEAEEKASLATGGVDLNELRDEAVWKCVQYIVAEEQQEDVATSLVFDLGFTKDKMLKLQEKSGKYADEMQAFIDSL